MTPKWFYIGLLKEMRQIVLQAVDSLPHKVYPADPQLAREALHEWVRCASCTRALMATAWAPLRYSDEAGGAVLMSQLSATTAMS
jgi:hypothetical protein